LIRYRPFRNSDPPGLAEIWQSHPPLRGLAPYVSPSLLEQHVFSKPYFDREGLLVAVENDRPIGFVHAGFGPLEDGSDLNRKTGVICLLMVTPRDDREAVARELLAHSEDYLVRGGAARLYGGGVTPLDPFYLGLYGGSELPGTLASDGFARELFLGAGYRQVGRRLVLHRELAGFRPLVSRQQMQIRRSHNVETIVDPPPADWWEACTRGQTDRTRFVLLPRRGDQTFGSVTFWNLEPLSTGWGVHASGLVQLEIDEQLRRQGLGAFLIGEALRQLAAEGVTLIETQTPQDNTAALCFFQKLGFKQVDEGLVLRKDVSPS